MSGFIFFIFRLSPFLLTIKKESVSLVKTSIFFRDLAYKSINLSSVNYLQDQY